MTTNAIKPLPSMPPIPSGVVEDEAFVWPVDYLALRSYAEDCLARLRVAVGLIEQHNQSCRMICGEGDQEGVRCKYRPYFPRHCPECPLDDIIELVTIGPLPEEKQDVRS